MLEIKKLTISRAALVALAAAVAMTVATWGATTARAEFGIAAFDQEITASESGGGFTQAGGHPYAITTTVNFNSHLDPEFFNAPMPDSNTKDVLVHLPPGLLGNANGLTQCTDAELAGVKHQERNESSESECPATSIVGLIHLDTDLEIFGYENGTVPVFNMVPPSNMPARFGFSVGGTPITLSGTVSNGGDFGVTIASTNIPIAIALSGFKITFWGVPADPSHDKYRCNAHLFGLFVENGGVCDGQPGTLNGPNTDPVQPVAFVRMPTSCDTVGTGFKTTLRIDSWEHPGAFDEETLINHLPPGFPLAKPEWGAQQGITGCDVVPFSPSIAVQPSNTQADTPTGLSVDISLPQDGLLNPSGIATSDVKKAIVTLPAGESVSPSAADGLEGCTPAQIGLTSGELARCPEASKLGTVEIHTPVLEVPLVGAIYLGQPECAPCGVSDDLEGRLLKLYVVAEAHGVIIKLPGQVSLDPVSGRIVSTFDNNPQLPFDNFRISFKGGPRSPLVNPPTCGTYETTAVFTPWSGTAPVMTTSAFQITSGPEGKPCPTDTVQAFGPLFAAGMTNNQAGAYSPLTVTFGRADGEQQLGGVVVKTPPGLLGTLTGTPLCGEAQANAGTCSPASQIGSLTVSAGAGPNPFYVNGGKVFLTTGYKGGEFGLSIVVPGKAGPFDLGTVVVRGSIKLDPVTTALTVTTDPLPTILDGIPLDLRTINVRVDKQSFTFNPTNCDPLSLSGVLTGGLGTQSLFADNFQVTNCGRLGFAPKFTVTTPSKTSRANGAGLKARIVYPKGAQANIAKVKVDLPKQLPSRLTTLQKACPDSTFDQSPDACPAASKIGSAKAVTPVLPVPLEGPVYFVSHGGAAFPDLVIVLKGYGITFQLDGTTFISKAGITSTSFKQVPDVPIDSFELTLPQGPSSALAANGNLCTAKLKMPTAFIAQDGAQIHQSTPITPTGCPKHKKKPAGNAGSHKQNKKK